MSFHPPMEKPKLALARIYRRDLVATGRNVDTPAWRLHPGSAGEVADVSKTLELSVDEPMKETMKHIRPCHIIAIFPRPRPQTLVRAIR